VTRYFFHLHNADMLVTDDDGQELADLQAASIVAADIVTDLLNEYAFSGVAENPVRQIEVADASGATLMIVPVARLVDLEPPV
jgi:hypothetical protein